MLQLMLHSHPRIAVAPETRFILPAYWNRLSFGDLTDPANRRALGDALVAGGNFGVLGLDPRATVESIVDGPATFGSAIGIVLRSYAERFGKPRWGEKRPGYYRYIEVVMRLFPDAQIVYIARDPRDCAASLKRMPWWNRESYHSVLAWGQSVDLTAKAARRWPVITVQYERLVADPEHELKALCAALGEDYDPAMSAPEELGPSVLPDRVWHRSTRGNPPTASRIGQWQGKLEPWEVALCETVLGERMQRFGYELTGAGRPAAVHLARYAYVYATRTQHRRHELLRDRWRRRSEPNPIAAALTSAQRAAAIRS
jgi:hypothetical protein